MKKLYCCSSFIFLLFETEGPDGFLTKKTNDCFVFFTAGFINYTLQLDKYIRYIVIKKYYLYFFDFFFAIIL